MSSSQIITYPNCINNNQAKSVCLHEKCEIYPFFCSTCEEEICELKHKHSNKVTSIRFKQFIKHVQQLKRPFPQLVEACNAYSKTLLDFQSKVSAFVLKELKQIESMKNKPPPLLQKQNEIVTKILNKQYRDLRGKDTDMVWMLKLPKPVEQIGYILSKREEIQSLSQDFKKLIAILTQNQEDEQPESLLNNYGNVPQIIKVQQQNRNLQKLLQDKQQKVSNLQQSVFSLSRQNKQLIQSRDQIMSQYGNNKQSESKKNFRQSSQQQKGGRI